MATNSPMDVGLLDFTSKGWTQLWNHSLQGVTDPTGNGTEKGYNHTYGGFPLVKQPMHMVVLYSLAYSLVLLVGLIGNVLVVAVVYRNPRMHSVTNYFIVNLAVADILVCLFCLPITLLSNLFSGWRYGAFLCKATPYLQGVAVSASVNTLAAIAIDRYLAICHTMEVRMTRKAARLIILAIWLLACTIMLGWLLKYQHTEYPAVLPETLFICVQQWPHEDSERNYFLGAIFLTCYTIPLLLITTCYIMIACRVWNRNAPGIANTSQVIYRSKVKVLKMLVVMVVLFAFSWLPLYGVFMRVYFGTALGRGSLEEYLVQQVIVPVAQWLGSFNSCVNPIIYAFFSKKYRLGFKQLIKCAPNAAKYQFDRKSSTLYQSVTDTNGHVVYKTMRLSPEKSKISEESTYV